MGPSRAGLRWAVAWRRYWAPFACLGNTTMRVAILAAAGRAGSEASVDEAGLACIANSASWQPIVLLGLEYWQPAAIIDAKEAEADER